MKTECDCDMPEWAYVDWLREEGFEVDEDEFYFSSYYYCGTLQKFSFEGEGWFHSDRIVFDEQTARELWYEHLIDFVDNNGGGYNHDIGNGLINDN